jgi:hypothetical protein
MGDVAMSNRPVNAVIVDSYGRAYDIDLAHGLNATAPRLRLTPALIHQDRSVSAVLGTTQIAFSISDSGAGTASILPLALSDGQARQARLLAGRVSAAITKDTRFSLGIRQTAAHQVAALQDMASSAFLTAGAARMEAGLNASRAIPLPQTEIGCFRTDGQCRTGDARSIKASDEYLRRVHASNSCNIRLSLDRKIGPARPALGAN